MDARHRMFVPPTHRCHTLKPNLRCDAIWLDVEPLWSHEDTALVTGISALQRAHIASAMWGHSEKTAVYEPESRPSPDTDAVYTVTWISQSPQLWDLNFVTAAQNDQDSGTQ